jgi:hypothetical protein
MGSGTFYPVASNDDGCTDSGFYSLTWQYLTLGGAQKTYIRFDDVTIPRKSIIDKCEWRVECVNYTADADVTTLYFNDEDDGLRPTTEGQLDVLDLTAGINWTLDEWILWQNYITPDLSSILQTVVNRPGFASGNGITLVAKGGDGLLPPHLCGSIDRGLGITLELYVEWHSAFIPRVTMVL